MARIFQTGLELRDDSAAANNFAGYMPDGHAEFAGSNLTTDTTNQRSGSACIGTTTTGKLRSFYLGPVSTTYYTRFYFRKGSGNPSSSETIASFNMIASAVIIQLRVTTGGALEVYDPAGPAVRATSAALTANTWYRIECSFITGALTCTVRVDGVDLWTNGDISPVGGTPNRMQLSGGSTSAFAVYFDDIAVNDTTGAANNSWCGDGKALLFVPTSDASIGNWTGGAAGTTALYDALNNTPPVGVASGSGTNISQIKNGNATVPSAYTGNCQTYTAAGIAASDVINAIVAWANHGEGVSTGTKSGTVGIANPSATSGTFSFGGDAGGAGAYPTSWSWSSVVAQAPTVTKGSALQLLVTKTVASTTRTGECDSLFAYVDYYTPPLSFALPNPHAVLLPLLCQ